ncbi:uncharacterized protein LOC127266384 [Andrographis paniculata]|uniref:uncharacterized protein LOC127266384 n=1 Tax=Andrographis paniculata TaxID=175694 RepID=UPI0021E8117D|nr:uncharacterized protein LOC127266384 [Andrographis paniculata]XP_051152568.1 uncharacterized protein LOC127266384 [Andrographis paniculata]
MEQKYSRTRCRNMDSFEEPCPKGRRYDGNLFSSIHERKYCTVLKSSPSTLVYQRKRKSSSISGVQISCSSKPSNDCRSAMSFETPSSATQENTISGSEGAKNGVRSSVMGSVGWDAVADTLSNGCRTEVKAGSGVTLMTDDRGNLNTCSANDNYSSSKSNVELSSASLKHDSDDAGECSSSGGLLANETSEELSERERCISILRTQGLLDTFQTRQHQGNSGISDNHYCIKPCKVCKRLEKTLRMLICDNCEEGFHLSCYSPHISILPIGEWHCNLCLKKKNKRLSNQPSNSSGDNSTEVDKLGSLRFMFRDTEPYQSRVRIGSDFQADIPDLLGLDDEASHLMGQTLEVDPPTAINLERRDATKTVKLSSIGNWIQCQEVIDSVDGTICGKWRRAPLFEAQTDNWECFRCVLWDPVHSDCAVPQEVDTEEVMRQLKYIDLLRPQLAAKRRKLVTSRKNGGRI